MTDQIEQAFTKATSPTQGLTVDQAWSQATTKPGLMDTASAAAQYYYGAARSEASKVLSAFGVGFEDKWGANQAIIDEDLKKELQSKGQWKTYQDQGAANWQNWSAIVRHGLAEGYNYASATTEGAYRAANQGISDLGTLPSEEELLKLGFKSEDIHKAYQMVKDSGFGPSVKTFIHGFERGVGPAAATLVAGTTGAKLGAAVGAAIPGLGETGVGELGGAVIGGIGFGIAGNVIADKAQSYLLSKLPDKFKDFLGQGDKETAREAIKHPTATFAGELAPYAMTFRPGLQARPVIQNASLLMKALAHPLGQRALSGVLMGDWEAVQELWNEGHTDSDKVAIASAIGTLFPKAEAEEKVSILNNNGQDPKIEPTFKTAQANGLIGSDTPEGLKAKNEAIASLDPSQTHNPKTPETIVGPHSTEEALAYTPIKDKSIAKAAEKAFADVGRPKGESKLLGTLVQYYFETRSARFKGSIGTPRELFDKEFPSVIKGETADKSNEELNQYIGEKGSVRNPVAQVNFPLAKSMADNGEDTEKIRLATGWFKNPLDNKWRYEISDQDVDLYPTFGELPETKFLEKAQTTRLKDVLHHPELYKHYPETKDIRVSKKPMWLDVFQEAQGWFEHDTNTINITPYATNPLSTILHEIQHWIQSREGFARGGNDKTVFGELSKDQLMGLFKEAVTKSFKEKENTTNQIDMLQRILSDPDYPRLVSAVRDSKTAWQKFDDTEKTEGVLRSDHPVRKEWRKFYEEGYKLLDDFHDRYGIKNDHDIFYAIRNNENLPKLVTELKDELIRLDDQIQKLGRADTDALREQLGLERSYKLYRNIAGEIEARDTQARQGLSLEERQNQLPLSSQTIDPNDVTVSFYDPVTVTKEFYQDAQKPTFYSALSRGVEGVKTKTAPPDQWIKTVKNLKGVKKEELDWSGLEGWLKDQKGPVSKADIQEYLRDNNVRVQEVKKGQKLTDKQISEHSDVKFGPPNYSGQGSPLPGGKDYRELLLTLPSQSDLSPEERAEFDRLNNELTMSDEDQYRYTELYKRQSGDFRTNHWDEPNVLAHVRFDTRTGPNGEKTLHVAEVQSDWHQKGRREGYTGEAKKWKKEYERLTDEVASMWIKYIDEGKTEAELRADPEYQKIYKQQHEALRRSTESLIPDAPFKQSWHELALKRMLRYAAEHGYDRLSWDTGETNADRFDLSHEVKRIEYHQFKNGSGNLVAYNYNSQLVLSKEIKLSDPKVDDYIGKDAADKLRDKFNTNPDTGYHELTGLEFKIGGEGMKVFYDKILVDFMKRYTKKWGAKVEDTHIPIHYTYTIEKPNSSHPDFYRIIEDQTGDSYGDFESEQEAKESQTNLSKISAGTPKVHSVTITHEMRESVLQGQPLFQQNRGAFNKATNVLKVFESADHSTVIHELGHSWLENLIKDSLHPDAPLDIKSDVKALQDFYNSRLKDPQLRLKDFGKAKAWTDTEDIPRHAHELFARQTERYLLEGKAPSKELATVFAKFRAWLIRIYQSVKNLKAPINDDVRQVFDRLLSTEPHEVKVGDTETQEGLEAPKIQEDPAQDQNPDQPVAKPILDEPELAQAQKSPLVDDDGTFRIKQIMSADDQDKAINTWITKNANKVVARKGKVTTEDMIEFASNFGIDPKDVDLNKLTDLYGGPRVPHAAKMYALGKYMQDGIKELSEAIENDDVQTTLLIRQNLVNSMQIFEHLRSSWAYTGHALQQLYKEAETAGNITEFFQSMVGKSEAQLKAEMARMKALARKQGVTVEELIKQLRKEAEPKWGHYINEFYRSNLITGLFTHLGYFEANKIWALYRTFPTVAAQAMASSSINAIHHVAGKAPVDSVRWGELREAAYSLKYASADALRAAADAFTAGQSVGFTMSRVAKAKADYEIENGITRPEDYETRLNDLINNPTEDMRLKATPPKNVTQTKAIPGKFGSVVRAGGEKLAAPLHSEAYVFMFQLKLSQLAYRQAANAGLKGSELARKIAQLKYDTPLDMVQEARNEALKATLMSNQSKLAKYLTGLTRFELNSGIQPLVPFEPFVSIAADIFHIAAFDALPLGVLSKDIRDRAIGKSGPVKQAETIGNLAIGLALMGTVSGWLDSGFLNGPASNDKKTAAAQRMTTGYPYSFRIGNQAVSVERWGPLGSAIAMASDFIKIAEYIKKDDPAYKQLLQAGWGVIHNLGEHMLQGIGPLSGFGKIFDIAKSQSVAEQFAQKTVALYEPGSIFWSQLAHEVDPYQRDTKAHDPFGAVLNQLMAQTPFVSKDLQPRIDIFGQPIPNEKFWGLYSQELKNDNITQYFERHPKTFPAPVQQPQKFKFTDEEFTDYQMKAGYHLRQNLQMLFKDFLNFEEYSEDNQHKMIQQQVRAARQQAMTEMRQNPDIVKRELQAQQDMLKEQP